MPSLMATIGMDASGFNSGATRVLQKTNQLSAKMGDAFLRGAAERALFQEMGFVPLAKGADKAAQKVGFLARAGSSLGPAFGVMGAAAAAAVIQNKVSEAMEYGSQLTDLSQKLDVSTTALQQWDYALKLNGGTMDDASRFFEKLASTRAKALEGNEDMVSAFARLGVSVEDLKTKRLEDIGLQIGKAFESGDPQQLISELRDVGGKGAGALVAAFRAGMTELFTEAPIVSEESVAKLDDLDDRFTEISANFKAGMTEAIVHIVDGLSVAIEAWKTGLAGVVGYLQGSFEGFVSGFKNGSPIEMLKALTGQTGIVKAGESMDLFKQGQELERQKKEEAKARKKSAASAAASIKDGGEAEQSEKEKAKAEREAAALEKRIKQQQRREENAKIDEELRGINDQQALFKSVMKPHQVNSLQQMGGFLGNFAAASAPENAILGKQLSVLEKIEQHLRNRKSGGGEDVEF